MRLARIAFDGLLHALEQLRQHKLRTFLTLLGMVFGVARGALLVCALVLLAGLTPFPQDPWWQDSVLVPYFEELALWLKDLLP